MDVLCVAAPISCWVTKHIGSAFPVSVFMNSAQFVLKASAFSIGTVKSKFTHVWAFKFRPMKTNKQSWMMFFIAKKFLRG